MREGEIVDKEILMLDQIEEIVRPTAVQHRGTCLLIDRRVHGFEYATVIRNTSRRQSIAFWLTASDHPGQKKKAGGIS